MSIAEQKNILRTTYKTKIKEFISIKKSDEIFSGFEKNIQKIFSELKNPKKVGVYSPLKDEVDWTPYISKQDLELGYPVIDEESKSFEYRQYSGDKDPKNVGISLSEQEQGKKVEPEVLLIPALAFDEQGFRLGRGSGYYDRYLENFQGVKIGIVYSCSFNGELPRMDHDKPVDYIVTEKALISCKNSHS